VLPKTLLGILRKKNACCVQLGQNKHAF